MRLNRIHKSDTLEFYSASTETAIKVPFVDGEVKAGFPSPADDFAEVSIDLNKELLRNPSSTFFTKVSGDSMKDLGISDGDMLVVDKSLEPSNGKVAVCYIDGEFTLKQIQIEDDCCWLIPANKNYKPIKVTEDNEFVIWGVVTFVIKSL
jgi:DNA polymerase V